MADVIVRVLEKADSYMLMTPDQARLAMLLTAGEPTASDEFLTQLIETNSDIVARLCNRVFARERVEETWRCLGEPCDCADAASSRRLFLSHFPVHESDIESVQVPRGNPVDPGCWELDETAGSLRIYCGTAEPIVVRYWGGFDLPDEAPPALRYALTLLVSQSRTAAQRESSSIAGMGIRSISHKSARVQFNPATATSETGTGASPGASATTPALASVKDLLSHFTRHWI